MATTGRFADPDYGMTGYKMREFDMIFQGDAAFVTFIEMSITRPPPALFIGR
jgi:hypothetical protein